MYERQEPLNEEILRRLISEPELARENPNLMLEDGHSACRQLLEEFPPDQYPSFDAIRVKSELIVQTRDRLRGFVDECLTNARKAREGKNLREEHRLLEMVKTIVLGMDIFDEKTRSVVSERLRISGREPRTEAEKLYREGKDSLEEREYAKALADLRAAHRLAPGMYEDLELLLQSVETNQEEVRTAKDELSKHFTLLARAFQPGL